MPQGKQIGVYMSRNRGALALLLVLSVGALIALAAGWRAATPSRSPAPAPAPRSLSPEVLARYQAELAAARSDLRAGRTEDAERGLQRCLALRDDDPDLFVLLSELNLARRGTMDWAGLSEEQEDRLVDEALAAVDRALEIDPGSIPALKMRWTIRQNSILRRHDPDLALEAALEVLRLTPEDYDFRHQFVAWMLAGARFRRVHESGMAFDSALGLELAEREVAWLLENVPTGSDAYAQGLYGMGEIYIYMGDFERAIDYFEQLDGLSLPPDVRAHVLLDRGVAHYRLGQHDRAASSFLRSFELNATPQARWLLTLAYEAAGRSVHDLPEGYRFRWRPERLDLEHPPRLRFTEMGARLGVAKVDGAGPSAFADFDGDGDDDILVAGCDTFTALFRNDGERFTDVTIEAGLVGLEAGFSTNLVDYDGDGDLDIYVARQGWTGDAPNILMRNKGDGTFEDASAESGLDDPGCAFVSIWSDFDGDGHLDVFLGQGVLLDGHQNRLYRNRGDGTFEDVTEKAGLLEPRAWGTIGVAVGDYDKDGDPDIFLNGRTMAPNRLYRNRGDGTFEEVAEAAGVTAPQHDGYVAFWVDMDNDAWPDLLTTSLSRWNHVLEAAARESGPRTPADLHKDVPRLFRNDRDGTFTEITFEAGLRSPHGVMGASVGDADNDGFVDIFLGTGDPDIKRLEPSAFYRNRGDGTFVDLTRLSGTGHVGKGHGYSMADFDRDGDLDLYAPQGGFSHGDLWPNPLYRNEAAAGNHWLHVRLVGSGSNPFAVGAQVTLSAGGGTQYREVSAGIGFGSTDSYPVEFGLGASDRVDAIEVRWPGGERQRLEGPPIDALIEVTEGVDGWKVVHRGGRGG